MAAKTTRLVDRGREDLARERREDPLPFWVFVGLVVVVSLVVFVPPAVGLWGWILTAFSYH